MSQTVLLTIIFAVMTMLVSGMYAFFYARMKKEINDLRESLDLSRAKTVEQNEHMDVMFKLYEKMQDSRHEFDKEVLDYLEKFEVSLERQDESYHLVGDALVAITQQNAILRSKIDTAESRYSDIYEQLKQMQTLIEGNKMEKEMIKHAVFEGSAKAAGEGL